ncbi:hypothetical protein AH70_04435 [Pediococcus damnosus LMG 28219]|uniref:Cna B-type domain-containing protein n=1 Tax=Pediococcus damnosus TaxID=51663 RepID=UPI00061EAFF5|nr:Cna B-type domain-containing protein [Pediococcus damnosus]KJU74802.1 hypothetical protein AH70_04435 [Pediococcus damnosus LMG 28219]
MTNTIKRRFQAILMLVAMLMSIFTSFPSPSSMTSQKANAAGITVDGLGAGGAKITDSSGNNVTDETSLDNGTNYKVNYNWTIADNVTINVGDTATVTLPSTVTPQSDTTVPIKDEDGTQIGTVTIKAGEHTGTITFTQAFNSHGRKGTLSLNVIGTTNNGATNTGFINKNGWVDAPSEVDSIPTKLYWNLLLNRDGKNVNNVVLTDTLGSGQEYIAGSLKAQTGTYANGEFTATGDKDAKVTQDGNTLTIDLGNITTAISIVYNASVKVPNLNPDTGYTWSNKVSAAYTGSGTGTGDGNTSQRDVPWGGGGTAGGYDGSVTLNKTDSNTGKSLQGAEFSLTKDDDPKFEQNLTTDSNGTISVSKLASGSYKFTETAAPDGYKLDNTPIPFTIKEGSDTDLNQKLAVTNSATTSISGTKTWDDNNNASSKRPDSITVNLLKNDTKIDSKKVTAADKWKYSFTGLDKYVNKTGTEENKYKVTEDPVDGYTSAVAVNGTDITNTLNSADKTSVSGTKTWSDDNNANHTRPDSVTINLLKNGQQVDSKTITAADNWQYSFDNLDKNDSNGKEIPYTVSEDTVPNYTSKVDGNNITNTLSGTTSVSGTKTWADNNNADGARPDSITVDLFKNGTKVDSKQVTAADNWKYSFDGLDKYDADGKAFTYTVKEEDVPGYAGSQTNNDFTNTITGETEIAGNKTWNDNNNANNTRPDHITVDLSQNGTQIATKQVSAATNWQYDFSHLAKYDAQGNRILYAVSEEKVPGYTSKQDGDDFTNTVSGTTKVDGTKTWVDNNNADHTRPDSITVDLYKNGTKTDSKTVTAADNWKYSFSNLDEYDAQGNLNKYTVKEVPVTGYTTKQDGDNFTNTVADKTNISGTKTWMDGNNADHTRPDSVTVNLLKNGSKVDSKTVTAADNWQYSFKDLDKYDSTTGKDNSYTVTEDAVPGYTSKVDGDNITNTLTGTTSVSGTKTWADNNNADGARPDSIIVDLFKNGTKVDSKQVTAADNWKYSFDNLDKYDADGNLITYSVKEEAVPGYAGSQTNNDFTNTITGETEIAGNKTWNDSNNVNNTRPDHITVNLSQNGTQIATKQVSAATNWQYDFSHLAKYDAQGNRILYAVSEEKVPGYTSNQSGTNFTNTVSGTTAVSGEKTWLDNRNADHTRPDSITIDLYKNGTKVDSKQVTAADNWKYNFSNLEKYDDQGNSINYTVSEEKVPDYTGTQNGTNFTNTVSEPTAISGTKTWNDDNNADHTRPDSITIDLYKNGNKVDSKQVTAANDWKYSFSNLAKYDSQGNPNKFTVKEAPVTGYTSKQDGNDFTNTVTGETNISGTKTWKDDNNSDHTRPDSITIDLYKNDNKVDSKKVTAADDWKYSFSNLAKYDSNGKLNKYTVNEEKVSDYASKQDGNDFTNTVTGETNISGTKTWKDDNNSDHTRPDSITIDLYKNGNKIDSKKVTAADDWKYSFSNLAKYDSNGKLIAYTVKEEKVSGYTSKQAGNSFTNTLIPNTPNPNKPNKPNQHKTPKVPNKPNPKPPVKPKVQKVQHKTPHTKKNTTLAKKVKKAIKGVLPQTGSGRDVLLVVIGVVLLSGLAWFSRKRLSK